MHIPRAPLKPAASIVHVADGPAAAATPVAGAGAAAIGKILQAEGTAWITHDGVKQAAHADMPVFQGDTVETADGAQVSLVFADRSTFVLKDKGALALDEFVYDPNHHTGKETLLVAQGAFNFVSGDIAKTAPEAAILHTPVLTIGIRGTTVAGQVGSDGATSVALEVDPGSNLVGEISVGKLGGGGEAVVINTAGAGIVGATATSPVTVNAHAAEAIAAAVPPPVTPPAVAPTLPASGGDHGPAGDHGTGQGQHGDNVAPHADAQHAAAPEAVAPPPVIVPPPALPVAAPPTPVEAAQPSPPPATLSLPPAPEVPPPPVPVPQTQQPTDIVTATLSGGSGYEGHTVSGAVIGSDSAGQTLAYHVIDATGNPLTSLAGALGTLTINPATGAYSYVPSGDQVGTDSFTVRVDNGHGVSVDEIVAISLTANPITAPGQAVSSVNGAAVSGVAAASDPAGDTMAYSLATPNGGAQHGSVTLTGADYTYTPSPGSSGTDSFQITVSDGHGGSATETITVTDPQTTVTTSNSGGNGYEGHTVTGQVSGSDGVSGDTMSYHLLDGSGASVTSLAGALGTLTINPATGAYSYLPSGDQTGTDSFTVQVANGHGQSADQSVLITLEANPITVTGPQSVSSFDGAVVSGSIVVSDPAGDAVTYALDEAYGGPHHGTVTLTGGDYTYTPTPGYSGIDRFEITEAIGGGSAAEIITVSDTQPTVTTSASGGSGYEGHIVTGQVSGSDGVSGDTMSYHLLNGSGDPVTSLAGAFGTMTIDQTTGDYSYAPSGNQVGTDTFTVQVDNGHGGVADQSVSVNLINNPMTIGFGGGIGSAGAVVTGEVSGTDIAGDAMNYSLAGIDGGANWGTVALNASTGVYTYIPGSADVGGDSFQVSVSDGHGDVFTAPVYIGLAPSIHGDNALSLGANGYVDLGTSAVDAIGAGSYTIQETFNYTGAAVYGELAYTRFLNVSGELGVAYDEEQVPTFVIDTPDGLIRIQLSSLYVGMNTITVVDSRASQTVSGYINGVPMTWDVEEHYQGGTLANEDITLGAGLQNFSSVIGSATFYNYAMTQNEVQASLGSDIGANASGVVANYVATTSGEVIDTISGQTYIPIGTSSAVGGSAALTPVDGLAYGAVSAFDPHGEGLTFNIVGQATHGIATVSAAGGVTWIGDGTGIADAFAVSATDSAIDSAVMIEHVTGIGSAGTVSIAASLFNNEVFELADTDGSVAIHGFNGAMDSIELTSGTVSELTVTNGASSVEITSGQGLDLTVSGIGPLTITDSAGDNLVISNLPTPLQTSSPAGPEGLHVASAIIGPVNIGTSAATTIGSGSFTISETFYYNGNGVNDNWTTLIANNAGQTFPIGSFTVAINYGQLWIDIQTPSGIEGVGALTAPYAGAMFTNSGIYTFTAVCDTANHILADYVNGVPAVVTANNPDQPTVYNTSTIDSANPTYIGATGTGDNPLNTPISDVQFWNVAMTASQVAAMVSGASSIGSANLVADYVAQSSGNFLDTVSGQTYAPSNSSSVVDGSMPLQVDNTGHAYGTLIASDTSGTELSFHVAGGVHGSASIDGSGDFVYTATDGTGDADAFAATVVDGNAAADTAIIHISGTGLSPTVTIDALTNVNSQVFELAGNETSPVSIENFDPITDTVHLTGGDTVAQLSVAVSGQDLIITDLNGLALDIANAATGLTEPLVITDGTNQLVYAEGTATMIASAGNCTFIGASGSDTVIAPSESGAGVVTIIDTAANTANVAIELDNSKGFSGLLSDGNGNLAASDLVKGSSWGTLNTASSPTTPGIVAISDGTGGATLWYTGDLHTATQASSHEFAHVTNVDTSHLDATMFHLHV